MTKGQMIEKYQDLLDYKRERLTELFVRCFLESNLYVREISVVNVEIKVIEMVLKDLRSAERGG